MSNDPVYHLELRSFPHVARVFNLQLTVLQERYVRPWSAGETIEHDDRRWAADRTKLTVLAGPEVPTSLRGLGRGWAEVTRTGEDVTDTIVGQAREGDRSEIEALKDVLAETAAGGGLWFSDAVALVAAGHPGRRASEQLALAEQATWEMLHQGRLELLDSDLAVVAPERWQELVLSWEVWRTSGGDAVRLRAPSPGDAA